MKEMKWYAIGWSYGLGEYENRYDKIDGILPKGPFPPCLRMADRALLAGYPRYDSSGKMEEMK